MYIKLNGTTTVSIPVGAMVMSSADGATVGAMVVSIVDGAIVSIVSFIAGVGGIVSSGAVS